MAIEVDFLAVGEGSKSGDAIVFRYGNLMGPRDQWRCVVVDGGYSDDGERLRDFIVAQYGTPDVDIVINSHPDNDHSGGLRHILTDMNVGQLWLHRPWARRDDIRAAVQHDVGGRPLTAKALASLEKARELEGIAKRRGISICERFAGIGVSDWRGAVYESLLVDMGKQQASVAKSASVLGRMVEGGVGLLARLAEGLHLETLQDPADDATSPSNNSSAILLIEVDGHSVLLTADAGVPALDRAEVFASDNGVDLKTCSLQQIPHHGSKRNMGPTMLDAIVGERGAQQSHMQVVVSAAKEGRPKHPNPRVTNAYMRRGAGVWSTEGVNLRWSRGDCPHREGYDPADPLDFYHGEVEDDE